MLKKSTLARVGVLALLLVLVLSSCAKKANNDVNSGKPAGDESSSEITPSPSLVFKKMVPPKSCESTLLNKNIKEIDPAYSYIPTKWEPAEGTDLSLAYSSSGIGCTFGDLKSETGITILWGASSEADFKERVTYWLANSYNEVNIAGYSLSLKLKDGEFSPDGKARRSIITFKEGNWVELNYSSEFSDEIIDKILSYSWGSLTAFK